MCVVDEAEATRLYPPLLVSASQTVHSRDIIKHAMSIYHHWFWRADVPTQEQLLRLLNKAMWSFLCNLGLQNLCVMRVVLTTPPQPWGVCPEMFRKYCDPQVFETGFQFLFSVILELHLCFSGSQCYNHPCPINHEEPISLKFVLLYSLCKEGRFTFSQSFRPLLFYMDKRQMGVAKGLTICDKLLFLQCTLTLQLVIEGGIANLDVTAPAGIMALGLMYLQTNDRSAAELVAIPSTYFELDYVRPDFILLRMLVRCLILWDKVVPSAAFVDSQLPKLIKVMTHWDSCSCMSNRSISSWSRIEG